MPLEARRSLTRGEAFVGEDLAVADATDVRDEHAYKHRHRARDRIARAFEQRLAGRERGGEVTASPGIGELVAGNLGATCGQQLDLARADRVVTRPRRDLVDLACELLRILPDELDQKPGRLGVDAHAAAGELLPHPLRQPPLLHVVHKDLPCLRARLRQG